MEQCAEFSMDILRIIALSLDLPDSYFVDLHNKHDCTFEMKHYPPLGPIHLKEEEFQYITLKDGSKILKPQVQRPIHPDMMRFNEHRDLSSITLLFQNEIGGLQVKNTQGEWLHAPKIDNSILINTGDIMQRWTNDLYPSTIHRVVTSNEETSSRYSMVYFCVPNWDTSLPPYKESSSTFFGDITPLI